MSQKLRSALGTNFDDLGISDIINHIQTTENPHTQDEQSFLQYVPLNQITPNPYQPRRVFQEEPLEQLAESIKAQGVLQPIVLRKLEPGNFQLVAGERRWRASQLAQLERIPAIVKQLSDQATLGIALVENIQRAQLNVIEEAESMAQLQEQFQLTHAQIGDMLSKSRATVSNLIRLVGLAQPVKDALASQSIDMGHARCLLTLPEEQQMELLELITTHQLSVRDTEAAARRSKATLPQPAVVGTQQKIQDDVTQLEQQFARLFQSKATIKPLRHGGGTIQIKYESTSKLQALLQKLDPESVNP